MAKESVPRSRIPLPLIAAVVALSLVTCLPAVVYAYGSRWEVVTSPTDSDFIAVDAVSASDVWMAGRTTNIVHYTGSQLQLLPNPLAGQGKVETTYLFGMDMLSADEGWAVGHFIDFAVMASYGAILHYSDGFWHFESGSDNEWPPLFSVQMLSPTDGWAVGGSGNYSPQLGPAAILHWDGTHWTSASWLGPQAVLYSVHMVSPTSGWAVGFERIGPSGSQVDEPLVMRYASDSGWTKQTVPTCSSWGGQYCSIQSVVANSTTDVWAVGELRKPGFQSQAEGLILHFDGTSWQRQEVSGLADVNQLWSIYMPSETEGWISGYQVMLRYSGGSWQQDTTVAPPGGTYNIFGLSFVSSTDGLDGWGVGMQGKLLHYAIDSHPPVIGSFTINGRALDTTSPNVQLSVIASDLSYPLGNLTLSVSDNGTDWSSWQAYSSSFSHVLPGGDGPKTVYVRVRDYAGNTSAVASATIELDTSVQPSYSLSINSGAVYTQTAGVNLTIGAAPYTSELQVSNDGGFSGATWEPYSSSRSWQLSSYGATALPRMVYVRFRSAQETIEGPVFDDIILDPGAPTGTVSILGSGEIPPAPGSPVTLIITAEDDISGVDAMQVSGTPDFAGAEWIPFSSTYTWVLGRDWVYVRFRDHAGNTSMIYHTGAVGYHLFVPLLMGSRRG